MAVTGALLFASVSGTGVRDFLSAVVPHVPGSSSHVVDDHLLTRLGREDWYAAHQQHTFTQIQDAWAESYRDSLAAVGTEYVLLHTHLALQSLVLEVEFRRPLEFPIAFQEPLKVLLGISELALRAMHSFLHKPTALLTL